MYAVVGCRECSAIWLVEGRPERTGCPRCDTRYQFDRLKKFVETDDEATARDARAELLAKQSGNEDAIEVFDSFTDLEEDAMEAGLSDEAYLEGSGFDSDAVAAAGETDTGGSRSRREVILAALATDESATREEIVAYAKSHGVSAATARRGLEKLVQAGEVSESGGRYRRL